MTLGQVPPKFYGFKLAGSVFAGKKNFIFLLITIYFLDYSICIG